MNLSGFIIQKKNPFKLGEKRKRRIEAKNGGKEMELTVTERRFIKKNKR